MADKQRDLSGYGAPMAAIFAGGIAARNLSAVGEDRPQKALDLASRLKRKGASPETIHAETSKLLAGTPYGGVHYGADGKPRFEISDEAAKIRRVGLNKSGRGYLGDVLEHDALYRAYPESSLLGVEQANFRGGGYDGQSIHIGDNHVASQRLAGRPVLRESARGVALHEIQHYAQETEGFATGASPDDFEGKFPGESNRALREHLYATTAGEVEAENVRARRNMTAQQRRETAPSFTETVPVSQQHLGPEEGRARAGEVRRVQRMVEKSPSAGRNARGKKIEDLGEKIGGARKDTAIKTGSRAARGSKGAVAAADARPAWARRYEISEIVSSMDPTEKGAFHIYDTKTKDWKGEHRLAVRTAFASRAEAERVVPFIAVSRNHKVYSGPKGEGFAIWRNVTDRKRVQIGTDVFATREEALAHLAKNAVSIIETKTGFGEEILAPPKPDKVFRTGPAVRKGDVKGSQFIKTFGFRGVEFGNWNNQVERQRVMNHAYDALRDLAEVTGLDPKAMSLEGKLGLAFGARGHGLSGARAHYERDFAAINLTKMKGAGSLAHEWMHALDHFLGRQDDPSLDVMIDKGGNKVFDAKGRETDYASHRVAGYTRQQQLAEDVRKSMKTLMDTMYHKEEQYTEDAAKVAKFTGATENAVKNSLDDIRKNLAAQQTYGKRFTKPATAEQLAEFDRHAKAILDGDTATKWIDDPTSKKRYHKGRYSNDSMEGISKVMKEVRGRAGFGNHQRPGILDYLRSDMSRLTARQKMVAEAEAQTVKTRKIPTEFAMNAKRIDQGRSIDYWTTRHEMAARGFSAFVEDKIAAAKRDSGFLSWGSTNDRLDFRILNVKPFPAGAERTAINAQFEGLFSAIKKAGVLPAAAAPAAPVPETSGLRGTQNAANLAAILENRQANAQPEVKAPSKATGPSLPATGRHDIDVYGVSTEYRADSPGDTYRFKSNKFQNVGYDEKGYPKAEIIHAKTYEEYQAKIAAAQKAMKDGEAGAAQVRQAAEAPAEKPKSKTAALKEARAARKQETIARAEKALQDWKDEIKGRKAVVSSDPSTPKQKPNTIKGKQRVVTLGNGQQVPLKNYVRAWQIAKSMNPETGVRGTPSDPGGGGTAADVVREMRAGMHDRINKHDPQFGKGRKWDADWQRDARNLKDTLSRRSEVPAGQAHPVDLRPRLAKMGKLEEGTFVPKPGGDRSQAAQKARNPRYVPGKGVPQESYWTAKVAQPTPTVAELPKGAFKGSQSDFGKLSPGMRREILRTAEKQAAKPKVPQVAPMKGMAPLGIAQKPVTGSARATLADIGSPEAPVKSQNGVDAYRKGGFWHLKGNLWGNGESWTAVTDPQAQHEMDVHSGKIGFQNKDTLNAALKAQGKAEAGKAQPVDLKSLPGKSMADLKALAKQHGVAPARSRQALITRLTGAIGKGVNKTGAVAMVAAPAAAAYVAYHGARTPAAAADGTVKQGSRTEALTSAAVAGGTTAAVGYGVLKAIGGAAKVAAKALPRIAPALGPVGAVVGVGMMGYGAYHGFKKGGLKGAALGAVGADAILDVKPAAAPQQNTRLTADQQHQFATANAAYGAMQASKPDKAGGWTDEARISAYVTRMEHAGKTPENLPYGGAPRKQTSSRSR